MNLPPYTLLAGILGLVASCDGVSGSNIPVAQPRDISARTQAEAAGTLCLLEWVTGDVYQDLPTIQTALDTMGVDIVTGNPTRFVTALRDIILVPDGFEDKTLEDQSVILTHELVHYCQRDLWGDRKFEATVASSEGRLIVETPAYRQSLRTLAAIHAHEPSTTPGDYLWFRLDWRVATFATSYWLLDLDPAQYEETVRAAWEPELDTDQERCAACHG